MNLARTTPPVTGRTCPLVRRVEGVEYPAPGPWTVAGRHATIAFAFPRPLGRTDRGRGRAAAATIVVGENPDDVAVTVLLEAARQPSTAGSRHESAGRLDAVSIGNGHRWALSGRLSVDGCVLPVHATLAYHGVWRRGDAAHGWFELSGTIDHGVRAKRRPRFSFELLADAPAFTS